MPVYILPDPTTRPCPLHRDVLMTDSRECVRCLGTRLANEFLERTDARIRAALKTPRRAAKGLASGDASGTT